MMRRHRSTAAPLAAVYLVLVIYASLYPFEGARWPAGHSLADLLALPWPRWRIEFDEWANLLGYVPLGALLAAAVLRHGGGMALALATGILVPAALSYTMEVAQHFIPRRHPSLRDWVGNATGAAAGALFAALIQAGGGFDRWHRLRERWFDRDSRGAIALLLLWPVALLFPTPVPLGLGQIVGALRLLAAAALAGTPWADAAAPYLAAPPAPAHEMPALREAVTIALGMLAPALLSAAVTRTAWHRSVGVVGAAAIAVATMSLSTALNFGPQHAAAWLTPVTLPAIAVATLLALATLPFGRRVVAALGLAALAALVALVADAPADPYYAASLQAWEIGRFIHFHGLAQWVGWIWPYAAMAWLVGRLARRD